MSLLDNVHGYLGQSEVSQISQHLGIDPQLAQTAIAAALPMIVAGMASHAAQPDGAVTVDQEADKHIDVANDVGAVLQAGPPVDNTGLLGRIFGQHHATVQQSVLQASGLDADKV